MIFPGLFLLAAGLNILLGLHDWPAVLAGSLNDPDSYMRLVRLEQGIRAGHLVITVARDDSGAGVMVEWSRLLDMLLWLMAAPLAPFIGWHRALFAAGVAFGPLTVGGLGATLAYAVEPFAGRRFLWSAAVAAAVLPGILTFAVPGVVHYHILLLVLIALTAALVARAWPGHSGYGFLAGISGGFAIWLTPETMPFVLMAFAALLLRWLHHRIGATLLACAAGFVDVLVFGLTIDPPQGGYGVPEIDRLSLVYALLGLLLLAGTGALWRLDKYPETWRRWAGLALMAGLLAAWVAMFPKVAMGPYGIMSPEDMKKFFGVMLELQPVRGMDRIIYLAPGGLALGYALWRAAARPLPEERRLDLNTLITPKLIQPTARRGRALWLYIAACTLVALVLGVKFLLFVCFSACNAAALLPLALSEVSLRLEQQPNRAMLGRLAVLLAALGVPELAAMAQPDPAAASGIAYPACTLRHIAPLLAPAGHAIVLAEAQDTPELLYRTPVETVGSLYQHGVPGYLRARDAWRSPPGDAEPAAVAATGAAYVLFCPQAARYAPVADLPKTTLWDALEANTPPPWLIPSGTDAAGWRLYRIVH
jgi:hypothetical protein